MLLVYLDVRSDQSVNVCAGDQNEIQKLRDEFKLILDKYSNLESANQELNESLRESLRNQPRQEFVIRRDPIDLTA